MKDSEHKLWKKVTTIFTNKWHFLSFNFAVIDVFVVAGAVASLAI